MSKPKFKIGDKVKLKPDFVYHFPQHAKIGVVEGFDFEGEGFCPYIVVTYEGGDTGGFPYLEKEIEHAIKVGEQLTFVFMK